jgi:hypothetical protein
MKRIIFSWSALVVLCASSAAFADDRPRVFQTAEIQPAAPEIAAEGAAWLKRSKNRVEGRVMAKVDKANTPYSIWWVIFNNPDGCNDGCGIDDVLNGGIAADAAVFNASGAISAASGDSGGVINVDISAIGRESSGNGSQVSGFGDFFPFLNEFRKNNGLCAEIHVDINEHEFNGDWVAELTYPENPQAFAVFPAVGECKGRGHHDDDD